MVLFFTTTLLVSIVGLVSLLWVKHWELQTGNMLLARVRPHIGAVSHNFVTWVERVLPHLLKDYARRTGRRSEAWLHKTAARALLGAEHGLERLLGSLRGVTEQPKSSREASMFLREVAEHKRRLVYDKKAETSTETEVEEEEAAEQI